MLDRVLDILLTINYNTNLVSHVKIVFLFDKELIWDSEDKTPPSPHHRQTKQKSSIKDKYIPNIFPNIFPNF